MSLMPLPLVQNKSFRKPKLDLIPYFVEQLKNNSKQLKHICMYYTTIRKNLKINQEEISKAKKKVTR